MAAHHHLDLEAHRAALMDAFPDAAARFGGDGLHDILRDLQIGYFPGNCQVIF